MPERHREALRLARDLDEATRSAIREWSRLNRISSPRWYVVGVSIAPFVLMAGGLVLILAVGLIGLTQPSVLPFLTAVGVWLPLVPLQALAAKVGMQNILVSGAARVGAAFAATPPLAQGESPNCRQCGAPLSVRPNDVLVRCVYCNTESIVSLTEQTRRDLHLRLGSARSSLAQAMAALTTRARLLRLETQGRTYIIAGLLILPLIWSFFAGVQTNSMSLLITIDVWVLGICVFWSAREALLPPVTIEELDAMIGGPFELPTDDRIGTAPAPVPGTRHWYDHAFEIRNFAIPATTALIFLAIELLVLKA